MHPEAPVININCLGKREKSATLHLLFPFLLYLWEI